MGNYGTLYFVKPLKYKDRDYPERDASDIIAMLHLGNFGCDQYEMDFIDCFDINISFTIDVTKYDEKYKTEVLKATITDGYGSELQAARSNIELYKYAKKMFKDSPTKRNKLLKNILKTFRNDDTMYIVLYQY